MEIRDYNGEVIWSKDEIIRRYRLYHSQLKLSNPINLSPVEHIEGDVKWIYPVMDKVIAGIESGDAACKRIGSEFIEEDKNFVFGKTLKANTARALRRSELDDEDEERIRRRLVSMLINENIHREYKEYAKLLKKIGFEAYWNEIENGINRSNGYVMKYYNYLKSSRLP
jgi:hypothetical protein